MQSKLFFGRHIEIEPAAATKAYMSQVPYTCFDLTSRLRMSVMFPMFNQSQSIISLVLAPQPPPLIFFLAPQVSSHPGFQMRDGFMIEFRGACGKSCPANSQSATNINQSYHMDVLTTDYQERGEWVPILQMVSDAQIECESGHIVSATFRHRTCRGSVSKRVHFSVRPSFILAGLHL
jgi:hypothetical protein